MIKFYYTGAPNPMKVALMLEETGLPTSRSRSTPARAISTSRNISPSIRTPRCRRSSTATPPCSIPTRSCFISARRPASSCRPIRRQGARRVAVVADVRRLRRRAVRRPVGAFPQLRAGEDRIRHQPLHLRSAAPFRHSRCASGQAEIHARRHLHHRRHGGVGLGAADPGDRSARTPGPSSRTSSVWSTRSAPARRRLAPTRSRTSTSSRPSSTTKPRRPCSGI